MIKIHVKNRFKITRRVLLFFTAILLPQLLAQPNPPVLTLNQCIETALKQNPQILASRLTVAESQARIAEVRAGYFPTVSLNASGSYSDWEKNTSLAGATRAENFSGGLSARYTVFQGFKTVSAVQAARSNYESSRAQHQANQAELVEIVTEAYFRLLQAARIVRVAEQSLERAQMHLDFSNALFSTGLASRSDILKAKVAQSDANLSLIRTRNSWLAAQGQLNRLLGRAVQLPLEVVDELEAVNIPADSSFNTEKNRFENYLQIAFQNRPEFRQMDQQMNAQQANIRGARSDYYPTLSIERNYTYSGEALSDLNASSYLGMNLSFPLFSGSSRSARVRQEKLALQNLQQQQEGLRQQIGGEVWNAYLQVKETVERVANSRIFYENALENRNIAEGEYREGVGSMLDVIDAQTAFVTAEQTLIEALADYKIALAVLDRVIGAKYVKESQE